MALTRKVRTGGVYPILNLRQIFFFFDTFGIDGLKSFIIQDDKKVIEKILFGTEQLTRTDNKMTFVDIKFNLNACKNLPRKVLDALKQHSK